MQCSILLCLVLCWSSVAIGPNPAIKCDILQSSDTDPQTLFVLECTIAQPSDFLRLPTIVQSSRIHDDSGEGRNETIGQKLQSIVELRVIGHLGSIPHRAFAWLPNLRRLLIDAQSNPIQSHESSLDQLPFLTELTIIAQFDPLSIVRGQVFPDCLRAIGRNLVKLTFKDSNLDGELGERDLKHFPKLHELTISNSPQLKMSDESGAFGKNILLNRLDIIGINTTRYPKSFRSLNRLKFLRLEKVGVTEIPPDAFSNFASTLIELHLDKNSVKNFDPAVFRGMKVLKILTVSNNLLDSLSAGLFPDLINLDELNLSGNRLKYLPDHAFQNLNRLSKLDLSKNFLTNITGAQMVGLESNLGQLDLSENRIRALRVANLRGDLGVNLASNNIENLKRGFFENGCSFSRLILDSNPLMNIEPGAFSGVAIGSGNLYIQKANFTWFDLAALDGMKSGDGKSDPAQLLITACPNLIGLNVSRYRMDWPAGLGQIVFTNNPKFVLVQPDGLGDDLARLVRKHDVQLILDGPVLCTCRWNWLRSGPYNTTEDRLRVVHFSYFDSSSPAACCNLPKVSIEDFMQNEVYQKYCNGTVSISEKTSVKACQNFDQADMEEPEAKKK